MVRVGKTIHKTGAGPLTLHQKLGVYGGLVLSLLSLILSGLSWREAHSARQAEERTSGAVVRVEPIRSVWGEKDVWIEVKLTNLGRAISIHPEIRFLCSHLDKFKSDNTLPSETCLNNDDNRLGDIGPNESIKKTFRLKIDTNRFLMAFTMRVVYGDQYTGTYLSSDTCLELDTVRHQFERCSLKAIEPIK